MTETKAAVSSMTGFGRAVNEGLRVEIRSVNHRYLELRLRLPPEWISLESKVRTAAQEYVHRGRVELNVSIESEASGESRPALQPEVALHFAKLYQELAALLGEKGATPPIAQILQQPGVLVPPSLEDSPQSEALLLQTIAEALQQLTQMRLQEGAVLQQKLQRHLDAFVGSMEAVAARAPEIPQAQFQRLHERLKQFQLEVEVDPGRLEQEVAILADKCDVTEELERLESHIQQFQSTVGEGGVIGRKLDFLCQEMLRETNTIGSKSPDAAIATEIIAMKAALEKMREQVQNVE